MMMFLAMCLSVRLRSDTIQLRIHLKLVVFMLTLCWYIVTFWKTHGAAAEVGVLLPCLEYDVCYKKKSPFRSCPDANRLRMINLVRWKLLVLFVKRERKNAHGHGAYLCCVYSTLCRGAVEVRVYPDW